MLMSNPWPAVVFRTVAGGAFLAVFGLATGVPWLVLLAGAALLVHQLVQVYRLERWLRTSRRRHPPRGRGLWGHVLDGLDRQQNRQRARRLRLVGLLRRFREGANAMPDGTIVLSAAGEMQWWNRLASRYLGLQWPLDRGQRIANLIRHPDFAAYLTARDWTAAVKIPSPQDPRRTLEIRIVPYGDHQQMLLARDVSELHRLETMRRDFVGNVSHELRTPLTVLQGMSEQLGEMESLDAEDLQRPLALMDQQIGRMTRLVDDLLLLSRLETERPVVDRAALDMPRLLDEAVEEARALSGGQHGISLTADESLSIEGDEDEIRSALSNLLSNAVKYTAAGGRIDVRWFVAEGAACLAVADTGRGIPAHHIPRLTERFYRVDAGRAARDGGTGLGLAIVKHVLSRHGARLEITSEMGVGSTFTALFPIAARVSPAPDASVS
ncbi:phosphate regulon sensor histidine kinase PhoR [Spiribacter aquaticus]|uniref:Phosphate regulon sensor protein PhoR n=1 Tax=Spiribacter aquaticus TaxID=1935996 RepID=A0A557RH89_9GAMM|nr:MULTISPECIES: phosphate regulon sensor histidine kinase PhoR [Spiribacter]KAF0280752.1 phosphate regulon sensor histidine kinase PhoR [Spiribacter roseus]TVO64498.1 phosphate regulon sensor histidine kinase PhoR [Spiribacter aquaticus]